MSRNGSGVYSLPAGNPVVTGSTISSTWANTTLTDLATAMTGSVASDGQTPMTNSLNMSNNRIILVTDPTNDQDAATKIYTDTAIAAATSVLGATYLTRANNLSDVANVTTSRTNLSAAKSGANSDITSITGLTTALAVAQGGTGAATLTANNVLLGNGTSALQAVAPSTSGNVLTSNGTTWASTANTGAAKAWVQFVGSATPTINSSFNVSSVTYQSTGRYYVTFTNAFADAYYVYAGSASPTSDLAIFVTTGLQSTYGTNTGSVCYITVGDSGAARASAFTNVVFFR
jgi:hypothetical protein